jgi:hypothetical protein
VQSAQWFDHDGDGWLDLHVVTSIQNVLFRGQEGGFFERMDLPLLTSGMVSQPPGYESSSRNVVSGPESREHTARTAASAGATPVVGATNASQPATAGLGPNGQGTQPIRLECINAIQDQGNQRACLQASSTPTLGRLYPLTANLCVAFGGNVGIGTVTPAAKLEVQGKALINDTLTLVAPAGSPALDLDLSNGDVYKDGVPFLHTPNGVDNTGVGFAALENTIIGAANTGLGNSALRSNIDGVSNTAVGKDALRSNTEGDLNTASGARALRLNDTGNWNTATGVEALESNVSGGSNTAHGFQALRNNTVGGNSAYGYRALYKNTSGIANTALGYSTLQYNLTGKNNTAVGENALFTNVSGYDNTACGRGALKRNLDGKFNTGIGDEALRDNTSGSLNTACGNAALRANETGANNAALGDNALFLLVGGSSNTACGAQALKNSTSGNSNIALGFQAGSNLTTTESSNIAIGNQGVAGDGGTIRIGTSGTHTRAFLSGVHGVSVSGSAVMVNSSGQLGMTTSSQRFKEEIQDMGGSTERLLQLRPITFRYKPEVQSGERPLEYGLIAEEVAEVFPDLVVHDDEGRPFTVKYHLLSSMLLNELQKLHERHEIELARVRELEARLVAVESRLSSASQPAAPR